MQKLLSVIISFLFIHSVSGQNLKITHLTGDFYIYTTYNEYKGIRIPANGMYVVSNKGVILIDSPWDTTQFQPLLDSIKTRHNQEVVMCIATHFHEDRTGGLEFYKAKGIPTYTTYATDELSKQRGMKRAEFIMKRANSNFVIGQYKFETYYPGHGHAPDNIVVWFEKEKILYGGCLVKSANDDDLGNLGDASVKDYANTIRNVQRKFKSPKFIIPGHNDWNNMNSLQHTLEMAIDARRKSEGESRN